jgi:hypothetical protein
VIAAVALEVAEAQSNFNLCRRNSPFDPKRQILRILERTKTTPSFPQPPPSTVALFENVGARASSSVAMISTSCPLSGTATTWAFLGAGTLRRTFAGNVVCGAADDIPANFACLSPKESLPEWRILR